MGIGAAWRNKEAAELMAAVPLLAAGQ